MASRSSIPAHTAPSPAITVDAYSPRTYISATNLGPMGWGIPAAIGVSCARPGTKVALFTGDGCMQMHGIEIAVAARYKLPVIFVVLNNAALGNVWLRAHTLGPVPAELTSIPDHDWAGFARALGLQAATVKDPADIATNTGTRASRPTDHSSSTSRPRRMRRRRSTTSSQEARAGPITSERTASKPHQG